MEDIEAEYQKKWYGLFGMRYQLKEYNLRDILWGLPELVDGFMEEVEGVLIFRLQHDCDVFFRDFRDDPEFLTSRVLTLSDERRAELERNEYTALEFTIISSSKKQNYSVRDMILMHLGELLPAELTEAFIRFQKDRVRLVCLYRYQSEEQNIEE
ncbi:hypothetical protein KY325_00750 [Candidatus Woesearchaeota archaeon]|nr:hypothetical protein [Candidatus Woesearchaeota archaeon]MBW3017668.1 hypothetical protein [Candidatus Woesearchaeota archaeon]